MKLFLHQRKIVDDDPKKCGLFLGTGSGKTLVALLLARGKTLVICPKTQRQDRNWERELEKNERHIDIGVKLTVMSKEEFKKVAPTLDRFDTVIIDESHAVCGLTPNTRRRKKIEIPKASQIFEATQEYLKRTRPERLYLCTATPTRNPMAVLAAGWLLEKQWDFYQWRNDFYVRLSMPGREVYSPKKDVKTKDKLGYMVRELGYTGRLSDWMDVPDQTHITKHVELAEGQKKAIKGLPLEFPEPIVLLGKRHQVEQGVLTGDEYREAQTFPNGKTDAILEMLEEFPKVLIFAKYTAQIEMIESALRKEGIMVFKLTGATKDRGQLMKDAEASGRCAVIAQSTISAGYELPSFRCTIFASESWSIIDHVQGIGRTLRMNRLDKNLYVYLVSGEIDEAVREAIDDKRDFSERIYLGQ